MKNVFTGSLVSVAALVALYGTVGAVKGGVAGTAKGTVDGAKMGRGEDTNASKDVNVSEGEAL